MSIYQLFYDPSYEFDRLFDEAFRVRRPQASLVQGAGDEQAQRQLATAPNSSTHRSLRPRMDLHESAENNTVTATFELPGLRKEDVNIELHKDRLTVSGESNIDQQKDENGWQVRERRYGKFSRVLPIPDGAKAEDVKASMENGVLTVIFPKASANTAAPQKVAVA